MRNQSFKKGAASFYMVAFSTLILLIIAASFAAIIISEMTRTANDDLSQSAYDSALAGVEDGKLAFASYRQCIKGGSGIAEGLNNDDELSCEEIRYLVEKSDDCDAIGYITGRLDVGGNAIEGGSSAQGGVEVKETTMSNNMQQFYTCAKLRKDTPNYLGTLSASNPIRVIKAKFNDEVGDKAIKKVKISWFSSKNASEANASGEFRYQNFQNNKVAFNKIASGLAAPPTISLAMLQAPKGFSLDSFTSSELTTTNRGMIYLVPNGSEPVVNENGEGENYTSAKYNSAERVNTIEANAFVKSNTKTSKNLPYVVTCPDDQDSEYACSALINLPDPVGGERDSDNFMFVVALPYGAPEADFSLEFFCDDGVVCHREEAKRCEDDDINCVPSEESSSSQAYLSGVQIEIDSTGRANDLFRRVQVRLEAVDNYSISIMGPLELMTNSSGNDNTDSVLDKQLNVTCEWNFPVTNEESCRGL